MADSESPGSQKCQFGLQAITGRAKILDSLRPAGMAGSSIRRIDLRRMISR